MFSSFLVGYHMLYIDINAFKQLQKHLDTPLRMILITYVLELALAKYLLL